MPVEKAVLLARIRQCDACLHRWNSKRWRWPRCAASPHVASGVDGVYIPSLELTSAAMNRDSPVCPLDYWSSLIPVDLEAEEEKRLEQEEAAIQWWATEPMLTRLDNKEAVAALTTYVERGWMTAELAEKILFAAKGIKPDAAISP